jgi:hypothetical protein
MPPQGFPVFYKEVGIVAHPLQPDSSISDTGSIITCSRIAKEGLFQTGTCLPANGALPLCMRTYRPAADAAKPELQRLMLDHFSAAAQEANMAYIFKRLKERWAA